MPIELQKAVVISHKKRGRTRSTCCKISGFSKYLEIISAAFMNIKAYFQQHLNDRNNIQSMSLVCKLLMSIKQGNRLKR